MEKTNNKRPPATPQKTTRAATATSPPRASPPRKELPSESVRSTPVKSPAPKKSKVSDTGVEVTDEKGGAPMEIEETQKDAPSPPSVACFKFDWLFFQASKEIAAI